VFSIEFEDIDPGSCTLDEIYHRRTDTIWTDDFFGTVIIKTEEQRLGMYVAVLGFARSVNRVAYEFGRGAYESFYTDMYLYNPPLTFTSVKGSVVISWFDYNNIAQAMTVKSLDEFTTNAADFLERAITYCSQFAPDILTDPLIQQWLTDFSLDDYRHLYRFAH